MDLLPDPDPPTATVTVTGLARAQGGLGAINEGVRFGAKQECWLRGYGRHGVGVAGWLQCSLSPCAMQVAWGLAAEQGHHLCPGVEINPRVHKGKMPGWAQPGPGP